MNTCSCGIFEHSADIYRFLSIFHIYLLRCDTVAHYSANIDNMMEMINDNRRKLANLCVHVHARDGTSAKIVQFTNARIYVTFVCVCVVCLLEGNENFLYWYHWILFCAFICLFTQNMHFLELKKHRLESIVLIGQSIAWHGNSDLFI